MKQWMTFICCCTFATVVGQQFYSDYSYNNNFYQGITVQNSFPKGGLEYIAPSGKPYMYMVFFTVITNTSDQQLVLNLTMPTTAFSLPASPTIECNLYVPQEEMRLAMDGKFNYGLDVHSFLDTAIGNPSQLVKNIPPNTSYSFYMVLVTDQRIVGVVRTEMEFENEQVVYTVNHQKVQIGTIMMK